MYCTKEIATIRSNRHRMLLQQCSASNYWPSAAFKSRRHSYILLTIDKCSHGFLKNSYGCYEKGLK